MEESKIWESVLRESSKRPVYPESTVVFVGEHGCGKSRVADAVCGTAGRSSGDSEILSYNYFDIDDLEAVCRINVWSFGDCVFDRTFELLGAANRRDKLLFVVGLDLSQVETCLTQLHTGLARVASYASRYYKGLDAAAAEAARRTHLRYLSNARVNKGGLAPAGSAADDRDAGAESADGSGAADGSSGNSDEEFIRANFALPVVVLGCRAEQLPVDDTVSLKLAKDLQGRIRAVCLDVGAAVVFTNSDAETNRAALRKYLTHRLYPEFIAMELAMEDKVDATFIPAGFDSAELIQLSTAVKIAPGDFHGRIDALKKAAEQQQQQQVKRQEGSETGEVEGASNLDLESEQDWLNGLNAFVNQVAASGAGAGGAPAAAGKAGLGLSSHGGSDSGESSVASSVSSSANVSSHELDKMAAGTKSLVAGGAHAASTNNLGASAGIAAAGAAGGGAGGAGSGAGGAAAGGVLPSLTRRASMRSSTGNAEKKDVGDFFKNLLEGNPKK